jgi:predicted nucleic acid-binding protein
VNVVDASVWVQRELEGLRSMLTLDDLDEALARESARVAIDLGLRVADATYVAVARRRGVALITWDREQRERSASLIESPRRPLT